MVLPVQSQQAFSPSSKVLPTQAVSQDSVFGDDEWDMRSLVHLKNIDSWRHNIFFKIKLPDSSLLSDPQHHILYQSTKEYIYARLFNPVNDCDRASVKTAKDAMECLKSLICWMISHEYFKYSQLTKKQIEIDFFQYLRTTPRPQAKDSEPRSDRYVAHIFAVVKSLWHFRERMTDSLTFAPFGNKTANKILNLPSSGSLDNTTPVVPDEVMTPFSNAALDYVLIFSEDILRAREKIEEIRNDLEEKYGDQIRATGDSRYGDFILDARRALQEFAITTHPNTGKPWRKPFTSLNELIVEEKYLFTACYILVAWLSGMRDSEITSICEGCIRRERSADGVVERIKIKGILFKGIKDRKGCPETWVTIEPVAQAIEVLERLTERFRRWSKAAELFLFSGNSIRVIPTRKTIRRLRSFAEHVGIPLVDGKPWPFTTRQFRRTLARRFARKPFGEIAGKNQYKHAEIAIFEGYMGRDFEFLMDVEEERLLSNLDILEELEQSIYDGTVAGPKGLALAEEFRGMAGDRRPDDEGYMLKHLVKTLYVGPFNLCFYDPDYALCQEHVAKGERKAPITSHCQPDKCPNSCITEKHHIGNYLAQINEITALLKRPKMPVPQRIALKQEKRRLEHIIAPLLKEDGDE
jgi:integrase